MSKNPVVNASSALAYIALVAVLMNFVSKTLGSKPDTAFAPVAFLSILTLSVAMMAYLFFYQPLGLLIEGKKKEAMNLFVRTIAIFGAITAMVFTFLFLGLMIGREKPADTASCTTEMCCQQDGDCGINSCGGCKAMNDKYIKPEDKTCLVVCNNGTPKCVKGACVLVKQ